MTSWANQSTLISYVNQLTDSRILDARPDKRKKSPPKSTMHPMSSLTRKRAWPDHLAGSVPSRDSVYYAPPARTVSVANSGRAVVARARSSAGRQWLSRQNLGCSYVLHGPLDLGGCLFLNEKKLAEGFLWHARGRDHLPPLSSIARATSGCVATPLVSAVLKRYG